MAKTYNRLEIDVNKKPNSIGIRPVQNDTKSRYLDVCLYENGVPINLTGEQVRITFRKADGSTFFNQGEVTDATAGRCQFALTNEILSEAKAVEAQISVWNAGGQILSTQVFEIYVTAAIPWTDAVESENEYGVLVVLFQEIQDALDTMHKIATTFGEPGDKAAEYGVDTFWGLLEMLAQRGDVESALQNKIKAYLNSTVGTSAFQPLDKMLPVHGVQTFTANGTFTIPEGVTKILVTACGGGASCNAGSSSTYAAGGQGGACIYKKAFNVTPGQRISITVGKGGIFEYKTGGVAGNPTVIGSLITLPGGAVGSTTYPAVPSCTQIDGGGIGGWAGDIFNENSAVSFGSDGLIGKGGHTNASTNTHGAGGGSLGDGAIPGNSQFSKQYGIPAGPGGGGAYTPYGGTEQEKVQNGGDGIVIIEW